MENYLPEVFNKLKTLEGEINAFLAFYASYIIDRTPQITNIGEVRKKAKKLISQLGAIEITMSSIGTGSMFSKSIIRKTIEAQKELLDSLPKR
ncbi:hypothetical protein HYX16_00045 [Candidatus Woesearchaeota archaeon]|nr:hypothetical protein [Candidatus Woesearchaeota archaeon]